MDLFQRLEAEAEARTPSSKPQAGQVESVQQAPNGVQMAKGLAEAPAVKLEAK